TPSRISAVSFASTRICGSLRWKTAPGGTSSISSSADPEHDPEKWIPVFGKACPRARPEESCSNNKAERDGDSKKSHIAPNRSIVDEQRPREGTLLDGRALLNRHRREGAARAAAFVVPMQRLMRGLARLGERPALPARHHMQCRRCAQLLVHADEVEDALHR